MFLFSLKEMVETPFFVFSDARNIKKCPYQSMFFFEFCCMTLSGKIQINVYSTQTGNEDRTKSQFYQSPAWPTNTFTEVSYKCVCESLLQEL